MARVASPSPAFELPPPAARSSSAPLNSGSSTAAAGAGDPVTRWFSGMSGAGASAEGRAREAPASPAHAEGTPANRSGYDDGASAEGDPVIRWFAELGTSRTPEPRKAAAVATVTTTAPTTPPAGAVSAPGAGVEDASPLAGGGEAVTRWFAELGGPQPQQPPLPSQPQPQLERKSSSSDALRPSTPSSSAEVASSSATAAATEESPLPILDVLALFGAGGGERDEDGRAASASAAGLRPPPAPPPPTTTTMTTTTTSTAAGAGFFEGLFGASSPASAAAAAEVVTTAESRQLAPVRRKPRSGEASSTSAGADGAGGNGQDSSGDFFFNLFGSLSATESDAAKTVQGAAAAAAATTTTTGAIVPVPAKRKKRRAKPTQPKATGAPEGGGGEWYDVFGFGSTTPSAPAKASAKSPPPSEAALPLPAPPAPPPKAPPPTPREQDDLMEEPQIPFGSDRMLVFWQYAMPLIAEYRATATWAEIQGWSAEHLEEAYHALDLKYAPKALEGLLRMRGIYVKLGQFMAASSLIPKAYCDALEVLQDGVPPKSPKTVRGIIEQATGRPMDTLFAEFDYKPVGAASVGQAHKAKLFDGREVIVKVIYPEVEELFNSDIDLVIAALKLLKPDQVKMMEDVRAQFLTEFDLQCEAKNLTEVSANMVRAGFAGVVLPLPVKDLAFRNVLVMDYLKGRTLVDGLRSQQRELASLLEMTPDEIQTAVLKGDAPLILKRLEHACAIDERSVSGWRRTLAERTRSLAKDGLRKVFKTKGDGVTDSDERGEAEAKEEAEAEAEEMEEAADANAAERMSDLINAYAMPIGRLLVRWRWFQSCARSVIKALLWLAAVPHKVSADLVLFFFLTRVALDTVVMAHGHQVLVDGVFNADPHPGNVLLLDDGRVGLIDFGQVKRLTRHQRLQAQRVYSALAQRRVVLAERLLREVGVVMRRDVSNHLYLQGVFTFDRYMFFKQPLATLANPLDMEFVDDPPPGQKVELMDLGNWFADHASAKNFPEHLMWVGRVSVLMRGAVLACTGACNFSIAKAWAPLVKDVDASLPMDDYGAGDGDDEGARLETWALVCAAARATQRIALWHRLEAAVMIAFLSLGVFWLRAITAFIIRENDPFAHVN